MFFTNVIHLCNTFDKTSGLVQYQNKKRRVFYLFFSVFGVTRIKGLNKPPLVGGRK